MKINDFVDKIYCINLDRRLDRWEECQKIFHDLNLNVDRFSAIDGKNLDLKHGDLYNAELAGSISHTNVIKDAKEKKYKNILILEDDVEFHPQFEHLFNNFIEQVPDNWDMIFFGGNHIRGTIPISTNVHKLLGSYAIHAYIIKDVVYDKIINFMENCINNVISKKDTKFPTSVAADYFMAFLHNNMNVYGFKNPHLAWQRKSFSDIQGTIVDYDYILKK